MRQGLKVFAVSFVCLLGSAVVFFGKFLFDTIGTTSSVKISTKHSDSKMSSKSASDSQQTAQSLGSGARTPTAVDHASSMSVDAQVHPAVLDDSLKQKEKNFSDFIQFLKFGPSKVSKIDYDRARREIALAPDFAVDQLVALIDKSQSHDVEMRQGAFAALAQVIEDVKLNNPSALDSLVEKQIEVVRSEVAKQELLPNDSFNSLDAKQKEELTHLRPFKLVNGKMYSMSLPAQLGALFSLGIAGTPSATNELSRISKSSSYSAVVRFHAQRMIDSKLF